MLKRSRGFLQILNDGLFQNSEISLRDVALNFSPSGNITRDMRFRSLADFYTQIAPFGRNFSYPQTLGVIIENLIITKKL